MFTCVIRYVGPLGERWTRTEPGTQTQASDAALAAMQCSSSPGEWVYAWVVPA